MSNITCPLCGSAVTVRQFFDRITKPFCARCGWNVERAESSLGNKATPSLQGVQVQPIPDAFLQRIQSLSRPRRVRFRFTGAFMVVVLIGVGVLFGFVFYELARSNAAPSSLKDLTPLLPLVFFPFVLGVLIVPLLLKEKRNRPLFQDGEVAAARVLVQRTVARRNGRDSQIDYEFRASDGQTIRNSEEDVSRKVFEDMLIPVFYDPANPSRCAALCASYSKLPDA